jgi:hypothetical protein
MRSILISAYAVLALALVSTPAEAKTYASVTLSVPVSVAALPVPNANPPPALVTCSGQLNTANPGIGGLFLKTISSTANVPLTVANGFASYNGPAINVTLGPSTLGTFSSGVGITCVVTFQGTLDNAALDSSHSQTTFTLP